MIIEVWDYDATSSDDLIGETRIDLENRFYSKHRATCGISRRYQEKGYNAWRDRERPTQILDQLCKKNNVPLPEYGRGYVKIGRKRFPFEERVEDGQFRRNNFFRQERERCCRSRQTNVILTVIDGFHSGNEECMALNVLHQWQDFPVCGFALVPEHVERRPLFNSTRPGLEQVVKKRKKTEFVRLATVEF